MFPTSTRIAKICKRRKNRKLVSHEVASVVPASKLFRKPRVVTMCSKSILLSECEEVEDERELCFYCDRAMGEL